MERNILRLDTKDLVSILHEINAYLPRWVVKPLTGTLPPQVDSLLQAIIANRASIQAIACKLRISLGRLFSQTFTHTFAMLRLTLDQALVCFSSMIPDYHDSRLREGLYALELVLRIANVSRRYLTRSQPAGSAIAGRLHLYHSFLDHTIQLLDKEIGNLRQLSRRFGQGAFTSLRNHLAVPPFIGSRTILMGVSKHYPILGIPSMSNALSISRGWRIGNKRSWRGRPCAKKDLPPWGTRYLRWLQRILYVNPATVNQDWIRKEARAMYRIIRLDCQMQLPIKHTFLQYQSYTPIDIPPEDFNEQAWGMLPAMASQEVAVKVVSKMLKPPQMFIKSFINPNATHPVVVHKSTPPASPNPLPCPPDERTYYQTIHGFDPETGWDGQHRRYCYNEWFSLGADPQLSVVGVTIGARVEQVPGEPPTNRILFRNKDGREMGVYCTHTVLYAGPADDALRFADDSILQHAPVQAELDFLAKTGGPVQLPPWGHFAALKSYVAGIAEVGILAMLDMASGAERVGSIPITFGFNAAMQRQVLSALRSVAPGATDAVMCDYFLRLLDEVSPDWLIPRLEELDRKFMLAHMLFSHTEFLEAMLARVPATSLSILLTSRTLISGDTADGTKYDKGFRMLLATLPDEERKHAEDFIRRIFSPPDIFNKIALNAMVAKDATQDIVGAHLMAAQNITNQAMTKHGIVSNKVSKLTFGIHPIRMASALVFSKTAWGTSIHRPSATCALIQEYYHTPLSPPLDPVNSYHKKESTYVMRLMGLKIQVHDAFTQVEFPVHEMAQKLPQYFDMEHPDGKIAFDQVGAGIKAFVGRLKDYKDRPLQGLGNPLTASGGLSRPYSEILGVPLTPEEIAQGLGDSHLTGCVMSIGGDDITSNYDAFLSIKKMEGGLDLIDTSAYEDTSAPSNNLAAKEVKLPTSNGSLQLKAYIDTGSDFSLISPEVAATFQQPVKVISVTHPWFMSCGPKSSKFKKGGPCSSRGWR